MQEKLFRVQSLVEDRNDYTNLSDFERILKASSLDTLGREVRRVTRHLGFEHFLYGVRYVPPEGEACQFILSGYPTEWMSRYQAEGYADIDPIIAHAYRYSTPLVWRENTFDSPERKQFMDEARSYGLGSGLSVPIGSLANETALVSIANPETNSGALSHSVHLAGTAFVMASYMHEAIRRLVFAPHPESLDPPTLTRREIECMRWWAAGKTAIQIGDRMNISVAGVHFHMQNLRRKLGVRTKHQAIARAILQGLINP
jgi:DNA-binding CsgD family transcriptional regulator